MAVSVFFAPSQKIALSHDAGGGTRTRTELSLQKLLSPPRHFTLYPRPSRHAAIAR